MKQLRESSIEVLDQFKVLFKALKSSDQVDIYEHSGIGKHVRHALEHYLLLRQGLQDGSDVVDYNKRERGGILETDITVAEEALDELLAWLNTDVELEQDRALFILSEISCQATINVKIPSFLMRELHYVTYHCIHHLAFCSLLAKQMNIAIPDEIGLAPATATYLRAANS